MIGVDEISIRKGHTYRIVVSDLLRRRPIWFGGKDRSEESLDEFCQWLGPKKSKRIRLAVMDMWKAFRNSTLKAAHAPRASILFEWQAARGGEIRACVGPRQQSSPRALPAAGSLRRYFPGGSLRQRSQAARWSSSMASSSSMARTSAVTSDS